MKSSIRSFAAAGVLAAALLAPSAALAADDTSAVTAVIGQEISIDTTAAVPLTGTDASGLTHAAPVAGNIAVKVTSTLPSFDVSVSEAGGDGRLANTTVPALAPLVKPLVIDTEVSDGNLTGSPALVFQGAGVQSSTVGLSQSLDANEDVVSGHNYSLTALFSAIATPIQ